MKRFLLIHFLFSTHWQLCILIPQRAAHGSIVLSRQFWKVMYLNMTKYRLAFVCFPEKELSVLRKENRKNAALAVAVALLIALTYTCWTIWLHSRILPADQMTLAQGAFPLSTVPLRRVGISISNCCSFIFSKPPCREAFSLENWDHPELTAHLWLEIRSSRAESAVWPKRQPRPSSLVEESSKFSDLKGTSMVADKCSLPSQNICCHLGSCDSAKTWQDTKLFESKTNLGVLT